MKSKLSMKIVGVVVAFATIASLLVGITAAPVSAAAPGANAWTATASPSLVGNTLTSGVSISAVAAAADGMTVFAFDGTANKLYKSTNAGATFGAGVSVPLATALVAIKVSPMFATDNTVVLADATEVYVSTNGGASFALAALDLATQREAGGAITSMDVGYCNASPTALSILLGISGGAGLISKVLCWTAGTYTWAAVGNMTNAGVGAGGFTPQVIAVKFSPSTTSDAEIMAVYVDNVGDKAYLSSHFGANAQLWNAFIPARQIGITLVTPAATNAAIAVGSDYVGATASPILVSIYGTGAALGTDNLYKVTGRSPGVAGAATNLLLNGSGVNYTIQQMVVNGTAAAGTVFWTTPGSSTVNKATGGISTFTAAAISKQPNEGVALVGQAFVAVGGTTVFASIAGVGGSVSCSTDNGVSFNNVGLIDVGLTPGGVVPQDLNVVDTNNIFLILYNPDAAYTAMAYSVFKTTNAGTTWIRIWNGAAALKTLVSPTFATDSTIVILTGGISTPMSTNGGATFAAPGVPVAATVGLMINGTTYFVGGAAGAFYKNTSFAAATGITSGNVTSIALNPKDATNATVAVGCSDGTVYTSTNGGVSFTKVSTTVPTGANAMVTYGPDGTLYAGTTTGVWSFGTAWVNLSGTGVSNVAVSGDGTLYASVPAGGGSVLRSLNPTAAAPVVQSMNFTGSGYNGAATAQDVHAISGATANSIYVLDNTFVQSGYTVKGGIYGFSDTMIGAATTTAPANNAVLTTDTSAAVSWPAVTGATEYLVSVNGAAYFSVGNVTSYTIPALTQGTAYTWSVRVGSTNTGAASGSDLGRPSATLKFTTALTAPVVATPQYPTNGAMNVPVDALFTWPASTVAGATYQIAIAEGGDVNTPANPFGILDVGFNTPTNTTLLPETLKYDTQYYWEVRTITGSSTSAWTVSTFTTEAAPVVTTPVTTVPPVTTIIVPTQPVATPTVTIINSGTTGTTPVIPSYLLWAVIAVGAVLVIAVIVLIVRTRRIP